MMMMMMMTMIIIIMIIIMINFIKVSGTLAMKLIGDTMK